MSLTEHDNDPDTLIDRICDEFEARLRSSERPDLRAQLVRAPEEHRATLVQRLVEVEIEYRITCIGEEPPPAEYTESLPEYRSAVLDALAAITRTFGDRLSESFVQQVSTSPDADLTGIDDRPPEQIGPYRILQLIGRGGMGRVYLAEQTRPVHRRVAVKVVLSDAPSKEVLARFESERQALAMMNHPNIARVLDAGITAEGHPFFAMELIQGPPINQYCDEQRLGISDRLRLFVQVCDAIQHAHRKGIIHRDIKPSNILVSVAEGAAAAKVIDFGLVKAVQDQTRLTDRTLFTRFGQLIGTPQYMSPEQAEVNTLDVDTRSDVYALGVILYELLTGSTPLRRERLSAEPLDRVLGLIRAAEAPRPSVRFGESATIARDVASLRKTDPRKLSLILRGELDWIAVKALEKDRSRRYASPSDLARDVERYLSGHAIEARPPSFTYQLRKAAVKYKRQFITATVITTLLIAGLAGTGIMWLRARSAASRESLAAANARTAWKEMRHERDLATQAAASALLAGKRADRQRQVAETVLEFFKIDLFGQVDPYTQARTRQADGAGIETNLTVQEALERAAKRFSPERIVQEFPDQPSLQADVLETMAEAFSWTQSEKAVEFSDAAFSIRKEAATGPYPPELLRARIAQIFLFLQARNEERAVSALAEVVEDLHKVVDLTADAFPGSPPADIDAEIDRRTHAAGEELALRLNPTTIVLPSFEPEPTVTLVRAAGRAMYQTPRLCEKFEARYGPADLRTTYLRFATCLQHHGLATIRQAADQQIQTSSPVTGRMLRIALDAIGQDGSLLSAVEQYDALLDDLEGQDSVLTASLQMYKADALERQAGATSDAALSHRLYARAAGALQLSCVALREELRHDHPALTNVEGMLGVNLRRLHRPREALKWLEPLIVRCERIEGPAGTTTRLVQREVANVLDDLARNPRQAEDRDRLAEATSLRSEILQRYESAGSASKRFHSELYWKLAESELAARQYAAAAKHFEKAVTVNGENIPDWWLSRLRNRAATAHRLAGAEGAAVDILRDLVEFQTSRCGSENHPLVVASKLRLATASVADGNDSEADALLAELGRERTARSQLTLDIESRQGMAVIDELRESSWSVTGLDRNTEGHLRLTLRCDLERARRLFHANLSPDDFEYLNSQYADCGLTLVDQISYQSGSSEVLAGQWSWDESSE